MGSHQTPTSLRELPLAYQRAARLLGSAALRGHLENMTTKRQLSPFDGAEAIALVIICRNETRDNCARFRNVVEDLEPKQEATA